QAVVKRQSGRHGQRGDGLEAIGKAVKLLPRLHESPDNFTRAIETLRNDAIACLAHSDLNKMQTWHVEPGWTSNVLFDSTFMRYAQCNEQGDIAIRKVDDNQELVKLPNPGFPAWIIEFSPDDRYLAATYHPKTKTARLIQVWDVASGEIVLSVSEPQSFGRFCFSPDSHSIAIARKDNHIRIYELPNGHVLGEDIPLESPVLSCRFNHSRDQIVVSDGHAHRIGILSIKDHSKTWIETPGYVREFVWSHDGNSLFAGCENGEILIFETKDFSIPHKSLQGHTGAVVRLAINRIGDRLVSYSWDNSVQIWDLTSGRSILRTENVSLVGRFSPDGRRLGYTTRKREFGIWEVLTHGPMLVLSSNATDRNSVGYLSTEPRVIYSMSSNGLEFWDAWTGRQMAEIPMKHPSRVVVGLDGKSLIVIGVQGIQKWPIARDLQRPSRILVGPPQTLSEDRVSVGFTHPASNGRQIVLPGPTAGTLFSLDNPGKRIELGQHLNRWSLSISQDGKWTATGPWNELGISIWDSETGRLVVRICPEYDKAAVQFSPDGSRLAISGGDELSLAEVGSWRVLNTLPRESEDGWPGNVQFSPDGTMLVAPYSRDRYQLIDGKSLKRLAILEPPEPSTIGPVAFSPDGTHLSICWKGQIHLWNLVDLRKELSKWDLDWPMPKLVDGPPIPSESPLFVEVANE
ncbi:MAG: WD40 repeat domain-containing protein, partial [Pirellula sp.]